MVMTAGGLLVDVSCDDQQYNGLDISAVCQVGKIYFYFIYTSDLLTFETVLKETVS